MHKLFGIYILAAGNFLFGLGALLVFVTSSYFWINSLGNTTSQSFGQILVFELVILGIGVFFMITSHSTLTLKKRLIVQNTIVNAAILLIAIGLIYVDFLVPAGMYTGGVRPSLNIPLHLATALYAIWALYFVHLNSTKACLR